MARPEAASAWARAQPRVFHGPSPWSDEPVVLVDLPHGDALGPPFSLDEARAAARQAHAWLTMLRGCVRTHGAAVDADGVLRLWVGHHVPAITVRAISLALLQLREPQRAQAELPVLMRNIRQAHPDYQAGILMRAAHALGIPAQPALPGTRYWRYGWGCYSRVFMETASNADGMIGAQISRSKEIGKRLFDALGLPAPRGMVVTDEAQALRAAQQLGWPCVVKPLDRGGGKGVTAGIRTPAELSVAFHAARAQTATAVLVETHVKGDDHRIVVVDGEVRAVVRREAPRVTGDGRHTVAQLLAGLNRGRSTNMMASRWLRPVALDDAVRAMLQRQGLAPTDVPAEGRVVMLRSNANLSTGGHATDVTAQLHPRTRAMAQAIAQASGIANMGLDYLCEDISADPLDPERGGAFIELNTTPGYDALLAAGVSIDEAAGWLLGPQLGAVPLGLLVTTDTALSGTLAALPGITGHRSGLGWTCADQAWLGDLPLLTRSRPLHERVAMLLNHQSLKRGLIVCSDQELMSAGMPATPVQQVWLSGVALPPQWTDVLAGGSLGAVRQVPAGHTSDIEAWCRDSEPAGPVGRRMP